MLLGAGSQIAPAVLEQLFQASCSAVSDICMVQDAAFEYPICLVQPNAAWVKEFKAKHAEGKAAASVPAATESSSDAAADGKGDVKGNGKATPPKPFGPLSCAVLAQIVSAGRRAQLADHHIPHGVVLCDDAQVDAASHKLCLSRAHIVLRVRSHSGAITTLRARRAGS